MNNLLLKIFLFIIFSGCANHEYSDGTQPRQRRVLNLNNKYPLELSELMSFKTTRNQRVDQNFIKRLKLIMKLDNVEIIYTRNDTLKENTSYLITPQIINDNYQLQIYYSKNALSDQDAFLELQTFIQIISAKRYHNSRSFFELYYNAKNNDLAALHTLSKLRLEVFLPESSEFHFDNDFSERNLSKREQWKLIKNKFDELENNERKSIRDKERERILIMKRLDNVPLDHQLQSLVRENKRKEVSTLLRSYLPWEKMAPFEKNFWISHLEAIEGPLPLDQRVLVIRDQTLKMEIAPLFNGQNKSLRALETMNEKFMGIDDLHHTSEYSRVARITNMFYKHSLNSQESLFLGVVPIKLMTEAFDKNKMSAFLIDPRRIHLTNESYLVPLLIFPDEYIENIESLKEMK